MCCMGAGMLLRSVESNFICASLLPVLLCPPHSDYSMKKIIINHFHIHGDYIAFVGNERSQGSLNAAAVQPNDEPAAPDGEVAAKDILPIPPEEDIPFFKYIHPSITTDEDKRQVHCEVQNLVLRFSMADICRYLRQMCKEHRVYLNVKPEAMFVELHRLGMPDETHTGFSYKNFMNYFNIND